MYFVKNAPSSVTSGRTSRNHIHVLVYFIFLAAYYVGESLLCASLLKENGVAFLASAVLFVPAVWFSSKVRTDDAIVTRG